MKTLILFLAALFFLFSGFQISYADTYFQTFEIVEINDKGIILKDFEDGKFGIKKDPSGFKVGDMVRYDTVRDILRKSAWQPAKIKKMGDTTITLKLRNGDLVDIKMKTKYRNEFNEGDLVKYKAKEDQLKKSSHDFSDFQQLED
ncbi:MAG: hypothetical protein JSW69_00575 [Deltaproteobacteria bacterium]|nr:MAG: hypothetical protein JSW69_00575 [Deltaproteobacteria bacterium]